MNINPIDQEKYGEAAIVFELANQKGIGENRIHFNYFAENRPSAWVPGSMLPCLFVEDFGDSFRIYLLSSSDDLVNGGVSITCDIRESATMESKIRISESILDLYISECCKEK